MEKNKISIVIASYNTALIIKECILSIIKYSKNINFEIIVVDNASSDSSIQELKLLQKKYSVIKIIKLKKNYGFGRANNVGAMAAKGKHLLFLNSDTLFISNVLQDFLDYYQKNPEYGVYSCQLLNRDKSIQPSCGFFPKIGNLIAWQFFLDDLPLIGSFFNPIHPHEPGFSVWNRFFNLTRKDNGYTMDLNPDWVTGAFMVLPKKVFEKLSGFDKKIFMYTEEMELTYRISKLGLKTFLNSTSHIIHLGGASGGSFLALTSEIKYMIYFWKKHYPKWQLPIVRTVFYLGSLLRLLIFGIIKNDETYRRVYSKALKLCF